MLSVKELLKNINCWGNQMLKSILLLMTCISPDMLTHVTTVPSNKCRADKDETNFKGSNSCKWLI